MCSLQAELLLYHHIASDRQQGQALVCRIHSFSHATVKKQHIRSKLCAEQHKSVQAAPLHARMQRLLSQFLDTAVKAVWHNSKQPCAVTAVMNNPQYGPTKPALIAVPGKTRKYPKCRWAFRHRSIAYENSASTRNCECTETPHNSPEVSFTVKRSLTIGSVGARPERSAAGTDQCVTPH